MQPATGATVLGDFNGAHYTYYGTDSTFFRRGGKFFVSTDGADGKLAEFEVKYTFGVEPLQQYLVELPDGRIQPLALAWDTRPAEQGGQRWFHLYPEEAVRAGDPLHWTGASQNWQFMCAECHSTDVRKNYDEKANRFATSWSEINVACEACHGPGSRHVAWAGQAAEGASRAMDNGLIVHHRDRAGAKWTLDPASGSAVRSTPRTSSTELETCAVCHARRAQIAEGYVPGAPLADTHIPALLTEGLYHADGQMQDEVYNYGSFLQSRMAAKGVTCGDCHEPHSLKLRASGDAMCLTCHAAEKYGAESHHRHPLTSEGARCAACHMPVRAYMVVDRRHDHSLRVPRPDLSIALGTPNACNDCHQDQPPEWAAAAIETWHGPTRKGFQTFGPALDAARRGLPQARELLLAIAREKTQPGIVRATAYAELSPYLIAADVAPVAAALRDPDALVRHGALQALSGVEPARRWALAGHLLEDPVRTVRVEAVFFLAAVPARQLTVEQQAALERGIAEYEAVQRFGADRPEAHLNLGSLYAQRGAPARAEAEYRTALDLDRSFIRASVNLADLYRDQGRDADGERLLRDALARVPEDASVRHALGLLLVREKRLDEAVIELGKAADFDPSRPRFAYVYGVALDSTGRRAQAIRVLADNHERHPADRETLTALVSFNLETGARGEALKYARRLASLDPTDAGVARLVSELGRSRQQ
jgi:Flp pilus assembly protein TadD